MSKDKAVPFSPKSRVFAVVVATLTLIALIAVGALYVTRTGDTTAGDQYANDSADADSGYAWDFDDADLAGWSGYNTAGEFVVEVSDGELCSTFSGGENPWDIAVQKEALSFERGTRYTLTFDARATQAIHIPIQAGGDAPQVFETTATLLPDMQSFSFEFTSEFNTRAGRISFEVGGHNEPITMCVDNVSLQANSHHNVAPETAPASPKATEKQETMVLDTQFSSPQDQWGPHGVSAENQTDSNLCLSVPAGGARWNAGLSYNGVAINAGDSYRLTFTARTNPSADVRVLVGEAGGQYRTVLDTVVDLGPQDQEYSYTFTPALDLAADTDAPGQVAFHLGGSPTDYEFCISHVSLTKDVESEAYLPDTGSRVRVNQVGYLPDGPKQATLVTDSAEPVDFQVLDADKNSVFEGKSSVFGPDKMSGLTVHIADFSEFSTPGLYTVTSQGEESYEFSVGADIYDQLRYDTLNFFYLARSGIEIDEALVGPQYARSAGHLNNPEGTLNDSANRGDYGVPCLTPEEEGDSWAYGDWSCPEGYALDVVGGWYDAGDHGKYVVTGGISVAQLLSAYERTLYAPSATNALGDSTLTIPERGNGVPDILDEARWELEFMMSMQVPEGAPLAGMVHHKIHDVGWTGLPLFPEDASKPRRLHRPSTAATLNLAASAAHGARLFAEFDPDFADRLLEAARRAWEAAQDNPELYAPAEAGNNGGGPYDDDEVGDEFYWASAELYLTTGEDEFKDFLLSSPFHTAHVFYPEGIFWGNTAGLGRLSLAMVPSDLPGLDEVRASVIGAADVHVEKQKKEGFGTVYSGFNGEYEWGSNSAVANNQIVLGVAYDLTGDPTYANAVIESMDYLLGRNALNISYVTGYGTVYAHNQHSRWFAAQLLPDLPHPPPGSLAGGPNSVRNTWDPMIAGLHSEGSDCAPQACYIDHIQSWSTNEITVNWNAALAWVASFVADQGAGPVRHDPLPYSLDGTRKGGPEGADGASSDDLLDSADSADGAASLPSAGAIGIGVAGVAALAALGAGAMALRRSRRDDDEIPRQ